MDKKLLYCLKAVLQDHADLFIVGQRLTLALSFMCLAFVLSACSLSFQSSEERLAHERNLQLTYYDLAPILGAYYAFASTEFQVVDDPLLSKALQQSGAQVCTNPPCSVNAVSTQSFNSTNQEQGFILLEISTPMLTLQRLYVRRVENGPYNIGGPVSIYTAYDNVKPLPNNQLHPYSSQNSQYVDPREFRPILYNADEMPYSEQTTQPYPAPSKAHPHNARRPAVSAPPKAQATSKAPQPQAVVTLTVSELQAQPQPNGAEIYVAKPIQAPHILLTPQAKAPIIENSQSTQVKTSQPHPPQTAVLNNPQNAPQTTSNRTELQGLTQKATSSNLQENPSYKPQAATSNQALTTTPPKPQISTKKNTYNVVSICTKEHS